MLRWLNKHRPIVIVLNSFPPEVRIWGWYKTDDPVDFALTMRLNCPDRASRRKHLKAALKDRQEHLARHHKVVRTLEEDVKQLERAVDIVSF